MRGHINPHIHNAYYTGYTEIPSLDKKTKVTDIKKIISLLLKQRNAVFIHLVLKTKSSKWWLLFDIHCC